MWTNNRIKHEYPENDRLPTALIRLALAAALSFGAAPALGQSMSVNTVTVDAGTVLRELPARHLMGHNFNFQEQAFNSFDPALDSCIPQPIRRSRRPSPGCCAFPPATRVTAIISNWPDKAARTGWRMPWSGWISGRSICCN